MDSLFRDRTGPALSFGSVADAYDRARPSYPRGAAAWLAGTTPADVLELGAGTGLLTQQLTALGHRVVATDPSEQMLHRLAARGTGAAVVAGTAEHIPARTRSADLVVAGQAFHWFDLDRALPEIARVLRPSGQIALVWNHRDERIPWVRRLGQIIETPEQQVDPTHALLGSNLFGYVDSATFRHWSTVDRQGLRDLVTSRSNIAVMGEVERERVLRKVDELYQGYGRGIDGMRLPYVTRCYKAVGRPTALPDVDDGGPVVVGSDGADTDPLLIDFS
ncbi:MAG: class I SAM-dependent methyltransferase [Nocardioidaceae bacterium]